MSQMKSSDLRSIAGKLSVDGVFPESNLVSYGDTIIVKPGATTSTGRVLSGEEVIGLLGPHYSVAPAAVEYAPSELALLDYMGGAETEGEIDQLEDALAGIDTYGVSARKSARIRKKYRRILGRFKQCRELLAQNKGVMRNWEKTNPVGWFVALAKGKKGRVRTRIKKCDRQYRRLVKIWAKMGRKGISRKGLQSPEKFVRYQLTKSSDSKYVLPAAYRTSSSSSSSKKSSSSPKVKYRTRYRTVYRDRPVYMQQQQPQPQPYYAQPAYQDPYYQQSQLPSRIALPAYPAQPQYTATASDDARRLQQAAYHMDQRALEQQVANLWSGMPGEYGSSQEELVNDLRAETVGYLNGNIEHDYYGDADEELELVFGSSPDSWEIEFSDSEIASMDDDDDLMGGEHPRKKHRRHRKKRRIIRKPPKSQIEALAGGCQDDDDYGNDHLGEDVDALLDDDEDLEALESESSTAPKAESDEAPPAEIADQDIESEEGGDVAAQVRAKAYEAVAEALKEDPDSPSGPKMRKLGRKLASISRKAAKIDKLFADISGKQGGMSGVDYGRVRPKTPGTKGPAVLVIAIRKRKTPMDAVKGEVVSYGAGSGYIPPSSPTMLDVFAADLHKVEHFYSPEIAMSRIDEHTELSDFEGEYGAVNQTSFTKMIRSPRKLNQSEYAILSRNIGRLSPQNLKALATSRGQRHRSLITAARAELRRRKGRHMKRRRMMRRNMPRQIASPVAQAAPAAPAAPVDPCAPPNTHYINEQGYQVPCATVGYDDFSYGGEFPYGDTAPFPPPRRVGPEVF